MGLKGEHEQAQATLLVKEKSSGKTSFSRAEIATEMLQRPLFNELAIVSGMQRGSVFPDVNGALDKSATPHTTLILFPKETPEEMEKLRMELAMKLERQKRIDDDSTVLLDLKIGRGVEMAKIGEKAKASDKAFDEKQLKSLKADEAAEAKMVERAAERKRDAERHKREQAEFASRMRDLKDDTKAIQERLEAVHENTPMEGYENATPEGVFTDADAKRILQGRSLALPIPRVHEKKTALVPTFPSIENATSNNHPLTIQKILKTLVQVSQDYAGDDETLTSELHRALMKDSFLQDGEDVTAQRLLGVLGALAHQTSGNDASVKSLQSFLDVLGPVMGSLLASGKKIEEGWVPEIKWRKYVIFFFFLFFSLIIVKSQCIRISS